MSPIVRNTKSRLVLRLIGPLRLLRPDGTLIELRSEKGQGLLALLGVAPGLRRKRAWLQDKLWSDREQEQGSASLRVALMRLRRSLGPDQDCLLAEAGWIGLDPARVDVVLEPLGAELNSDGEAPEFCEGLDVQDEEFEDWIRDQRQVWADRLEAPPPVPAPVVLRSADLRSRRPTPRLLIAAPQIEDDGLRSIVSLIGAQIASHVTELGGAKVVFEAGIAMQPPADGTDTVQLAMHAFRCGDATAIQACLTDPSRGSMLWSRTRRLSLESNGHTCAAALDIFVAEAVSAIAFELGREAPGEALPSVRAGYRALRGALSFEGFAFDECDRMLAATAEEQHSPVLRAWRAHLRVVTVLERLTADTDEAGQEAIAFATQAMERDPLNPIVNAIAADVALHVEVLPQKAAHLARLAVDRAPASPFTHASLAQALARAGKDLEAHVAAMRALRLAAGQPNQGWWYMRCCVTAVRLKRYHEAARYAQLAYEMAPNFRAPLRFLSALRYHLRDEAGALIALRALKRLEPDFSLDLMASDEYRIATLRGTPLMAVTRSGLV